MYSPSYGDEEPIAAPATVLAESALTLIRTSGRNAPALAASCFSRPEKLRDAPGNTVVHGWIMDGQERLDETVIAVFRAPRSYTGEDALDISCHGGAAAAKAVMGALKKAGFRDALPGEFTFRAFMNGKLDLTRAESVMELVTAKTGQGRRRAVGRLSGGLEGEIREIKAKLVSVLAGVELLLDYSEDEALIPVPADGVAGPAEATGALPDRPLAEEALTRLRSLAASYARERLYHDGALVVIAGRPNAGKSSLFNLLLREDRAIVTDVPGTTRDWIEGWIALDGIPIRLVDTAGLHISADPLERLGMERSRELVCQADLILYVLDGSRGLTIEDRAFPEDFHAGNPDDTMAPVILIWNKADLAPPPDASLPDWPAFDTNGASGKTLLGISAKTGQGLGELTARIAAALEGLAGGTETDNGLSSQGIGTARQKELVDRAVEAVAGSLELADREAPLDLIAPLLREGIDSLGEITGDVSTADILETMFSRFCVGK